MAMDMMSRGNGFPGDIQSVAFPTTQGSFSDTLLLFKPHHLPAGANSSTVFAVEILLEWCVLTYNTSVRGGIASTTVTNTYTNFTRSSAGSQVYTNHPDGELYTVESLTNLSINQSMKALLNGSYFMGPSTPSLYSTNAIQAIVNAVNAPPYDIAGIQLVFENLVTSMNNKYVILETLLGSSNHDSYTDNNIS